MSNRKYELTETKVVDGVTLHRIRAVRNFANVKIGDLGGWIEKEANLSHDGDAWVFGNAKVFGSARVYGEASVDAVLTTAVRSDGYTFALLPYKDKTIRISAGCRFFTMAEAEDHWQKTRGGTPLGNETFAILNMFKEEAKVRGWEYN